MLGQTLAGRYKLTRILGAGGFGQTYLALDTHQRPLEGQGNVHSVQVINQCVVKQLQPASQDTNFLSVARRLFETEAKTLGRLGSHAQIPQLLNFFEEDNEFYLVQEYIDGQSLEDEIKELGHLNEADIIALLEDVLPVLQFIHDNHVVHRDLKPDNLIRRRDNGKLVLIDFGAVKEIRTKIITGEQTALTIGIGTQGYTPSEQLSGKPRYSSDLYALGMTAIHALTGKAPSDIPEDFDSLDPQWQNYAQVSPGLAIVLSKMTRHYIYQRYGNVKEVLHDLSRLEELPAEAAAAPTYLETSIPEDRLVPPAPKVLRWRMGKRAKKLTVAIATVLTSAFVLGLRHIEAFVPSELAAHDWLVSQQEDLGPDSRLLLVEVTDADIQSLGGILSDEALAIAIENIQQHDPATIGLGLLRSVPRAPGTARLLKSLTMSNVVATTRLGNFSSGDFVPPPPGMPVGQISFNDIIVDSDFRVRRSLMLGAVGISPNNVVTSQQVSNPPSNPLRVASDISTEEVPIFSLAAELAIRYLDIQHDIQPAESDILTLGDVRFNPISSTFGAYRGENTNNYQIFTDYRSPRSVAPTLSLRDMLGNNFDPALVKDKIVLIGYTNRNNGEMFFTTYNTSGNREQMPSVVIHAHAISQILSTVLDGEPLPWASPDWVEVVWIISLTGIGSTLMVLSQRAPILIGFGVSGLVVACLVSVVSFQSGGWVPMTAPMSAFFLSAAGARISKSYQRRYWEARQSS
ncbi:MAG: CHASE2 domain-containing protein [Phormidesmis sp.]